MTPLIFLRAQILYPGICLKVMLLATPAFFEHFLWQSQPSGASISVSLWCLGQGVPIDFFYFSLCANFWIRRLSIQFHFKRESLPCPVLSGELSSLPILGQSLIHKSDQLRAVWIPIESLRMAAAIFSYCAPFSVRMITTFEEAATSGID